MLNTARIRQAIAEFNTRYDEIEGIGDQLHIAAPASDEAITALAPHFALAMPPALIQFYRELGGIQSEDVEVLSITLDPPERLLADLQQEERWYRLDSMGLIDYIKFVWTHDRPEFDDIPPEHIAHINQHYRCFGFYRTRWGYEEGRYFYFDPQGHFGLMRYHQDEFDALWEEHLTGMLTQSPAHQTFDALLLEAIAELRGELEGA